MENPTALPSELRGECFEDSSLLSVTFAKLFETHDDPNPNEQKLSSVQILSGPLYDPPASQPPTPPQDRKEA